MKNKFTSLTGYERRLEDEMLKKSQSFLENITKRRSVREFSEEQVSGEIIKNAVKAAASAPSGANMQPWFFCAVSDPEVKRKIREEAEKEELKFYKEKASGEWLKDLSSLGTNYQKPFLEAAPWLIVVFEKKYGLLEDGAKKKYYYTKESVGLAAGTLINALHFSGLATLTYTPSPMSFLNGILDRPQNEKPYMIIVTGYPSLNAKLPEIEKKSFEETAKFF